MHGIRTFADWFERLRSLLRKAQPGIEVEKLHFGYFSLFLLAFPWFRKHAVEQYADILLSRLRQLDDHKVDIVAHSFGTLVLATALSRLKRELPSSPTLPPIQNLILAGSVLKHEFPWKEFCPTFVRRITNDCGTRDLPLLFSMIALVGLGYGGRRGFDGIENLQFANRFFEFGHSGFFKKNGKPYDEFMSRYWVPILTGDASVEEVPDPRHFGRAAWFIAWLETWADPLKIFVHTVVLVIPMSAGWLLYSAERTATALAKANLQAAHSLSDVSLDGIDSLRLALSAAGDHESAEINAALKANLDVAAEPIAWISHQSPTGIDQAARHPKLPVFAISFNIGGKTVVSVIEAPSGKQIGSFSGSMNGEDVCRINAQPNNLRFSPKGNYLILESIAGACVWSLAERRIIFSDPARRRVEINSDDSSALLIDGMVSGSQHVDLLDFHTGEIKSVDLAPFSSFDDIKFISTGVGRLKDGRLIFKSFGNDEAHTVFANAPSRFTNFYVSSSGQLAFCTTDRGEVVAVNPGSGDVLWRKELGQELSRVDFSPDSNLIAGQLGDGTSIVWRSNNGVEVANFKTTGYAEGISFVGESSKFILTNNRGHDLKIWDVESQALWRKLPRDVYQSGSAVSADGRYAISGGSNKTALIWRLYESGFDSKHSLKASSEVMNIALDAAAKKLLVLGQEGDVTLWNTDTLSAKLINEASTTDSGFHQSSSIDNKGEFGVIETRAGVIKAIDFQTGRERWKYTLPRLFSHELISSRTGESGSVKITLLYPNNAVKFPISCPATSRLVKWKNGEVDKIGGGYIFRTCSPESLGESVRSQVISTDIFRGPIRISPSGKFVLVSILDMLNIIDASDGHLIATLSLGYDSAVNDALSLNLGNGLRFQRLRDVAFLDDDSVVALTYGNMLLNWKREGDGFSEGSVKFLPSTTHFQRLSGKTSSCYFYDVRTGDVLQLNLKTLESKSLDRLDQIVSIFTDDASSRQRVAVITSERPELIHVGEGPVHVPYTISIWEGVKRKRIFGMTTDYPIRVVAFSQDGKYVAIGESSGLIRVYALRNGIEQTRIQRDEGVKTLAFVDHDKYILSSTGPTETYPTTTGTDTIQLDIWKTLDLRREGCKVLGNQWNDSMHCSSL